ncbi:DcaP family trimeric outer membrane transporter [Thalassolituus sp.]|jgi:hypothetical protein|uniref:DcaP family trimeric outer membrane transporter n=1 Tax=Thalassolituus sp. TaxID=2030822 RepID=UPI0032D8DD80
MRKLPMVLLATAALPLAVNAANTELTYGGYIKMDAMLSTYSDGDIAPANIGRDFYVPSTIPVGGQDEGADLDYSAKSTRLNMKTVTTLEDGETVTGFIEMDFLSSPGGTEVVSNSYNPRLRHAFFKYDGLTAGQTWTTFMNTGALPETVDFLGPSESSVFVRQTQFRYTMGDFDLAIENPETTVDGAVSDDGMLPDFVARYNIKSGNSNFAVAALVRQLSYEDAVNNVDSTTAMGFGINVSGKIMIGGDDLKLSLTSGTGVGRYVGLGAVTDANLVNGDLKASKTTAAFIAYRHHWTSKLRSTAMYSMLTADYDSAAPTTSTTDISSVRVNLMYNPVEPITYGVEYSMATREIDNGANGDMSRLQVSAKYSF